MAFDRFHGFLRLPVEFEPDVFPNGSKEKKNFKILGGLWPPTLTHSSAPALFLLDEFLLLTFTDFLTLTLEVMWQAPQQCIKVLLLIF